MSEENVSGNVAGGDASQGTAGSNDLTQSIAAAVAAAVTSSLNEITNKLNALESRVKQTSANDDTNFETSVVGAYDPFDDLRRANVSRDRISVYAEQALANSIEVSHRCAMMHLDHSASLPPVAVKAA